MYVTYALWKMWTAFCLERAGDAGNTDGCFSGQVFVFTRTLSCRIHDSALCVGDSILRALLLGWPSISSSPSLFSSLDFSVAEKMCILKQWQMIQFVESLWFRIDDVYWSVFLRLSGW